MNTPQKKSRNQAGFTLFELLLVIAIIGVLASVSLPNFADFRATAYDARSQQDLRNLASAQELHRSIEASYAASLDDLASYSSSDGVSLTITDADADRFRATATHPSGNKTFVWDSNQSPPLQEGGGAL